MVACLLLGTFLVMMNKKDCLMNGYVQVGRSGIQETIKGRGVWHNRLYSNGFPSSPAFSCLVLAYIQHTSETLVFLHNGEQVRLGALGAAPEVKGHKELPGFFYDAVHFGITAANPGLLMITVRIKSSLLFLGYDLDLA